MTNKTNKTNKKNKGGKVIASGGFGCVFSPALKCEGKPREKNKITKLMTEKHALQEYNEIKKIKGKLDKIKDYEDYFLIKDFTLCKPAELSNSDLIKFKAKCTALPKSNILKKNINKKLDKIMALNMPNGGIPVDDFIYKNISYENIINLNTSLVGLLINGIEPMNKRNVYHGDIKDSNILVLQQSGNLNTRLIDWGLSTEYIPGIEQKFPNPWRNRPLQFNVPFSVIIFTNFFIEKYTKYIKDGGKLDETSLKPFVMEYIYFWMKERGEGHYIYINKIMKILFGHEIKMDDEEVKEQLIETNFTLAYISNYIIEILKKFTRFRKNGTLNLRVYLDEVFIKIVDIWGFVATYIPLLEVLNENYKSLNETEMKVFELLKYIFIEYLYSPRIKPIDIMELANEFRKINKLLLNNLIDKTSEKPNIKSSVSNRVSGITGETFVPKSPSFIKSTSKKTTAKKNNKTKKNIKSQ